MQVRIKTFIKFIGSKLNQGDIARVVAGPAKTIKFETLLSTVAGNKFSPPVSLHSR
jgi:hypothetical protein